MIWRFLLVPALLLKVYALLPSFANSNPYQLCNSKDILIVGDGDFSFSRCVAESRCFNTLSASTLDNEEDLYINFQKSRENVAAICSIENCKVLYGMDATDINAKYNSTYDIIIWNFPHIIGKHNIKYNRELLQAFLSSARKALRPDMPGHVIVALTTKQSGVSSSSTSDWNASWKLAHQAAEAGLLLLDSYPFDPSNFPGYSPIGHRGYGGAFPYRSPELYVLAKPSLSSSSLCEDIIACQAPLYVHEVHLLVERLVDNLADFEAVAATEVRKIAADIQWSDAVWSVHIVDLYVCPRTQLISHTIQVLI